MNFLRRDHPGGWRAWIEFASGPEVLAAIGALDRGLAVDGDAFAAVNGAQFFDWMSGRPGRHAVFDAAMAAGGQMHGLLIARALEWSGARRVCDVGGGDGALLSVLLAEHEQLDGVVFELPEVAARVRARPRLGAVGGDAFEVVPSGFDTYLLVNVLHDWDDAAAERLLTNVARALTALEDEDSSALAPSRRVVIVESEAHVRPRDDLAIRADLLMLALTPGGRERTVEELVALGARAGLRRQRVRRLASGDVALVLVPEGA
jgi:SAM-dependent methyltransferase